MILIIGLGNPGGKYERNRHNVGFIVVDKLRKLLNFPDFKFEKKFNSEISKKNYELRVTDYELLLIKPQTFMNKSGDAVRKIMSFYKLTPRDIIIIHDDLDIEIGKYKLSTDTHSVGHKGVEDIIAKLGTQEFKRIRIGVETEGGRQNRKIPGDNFVLQNFSEEEYKKVLAQIQNIAKEIYPI